MNSKTVVAVVLALSLVSATVSYGQGNDRGRGDGRQNAQSRGYDGDRGNNGRGYGRGNARKDFRNDNGPRGWPGWQAQPSYRAGHSGPGAGRNHDFYRGDRLPYEYRHSNYVVNDWRGHRLSAPPRGYHWVQTGPDYVLIAIATGVIAQILLGN